MTVVVVDDDQDVLAIDVERWRALALAVLVDEDVADDAELSVRFVDEHEIEQLNVEFLGHDGPTDVLSFPIEDDPRAPSGDGAPLLLGDVVICPAVAERNAPEHAGTFDDEIALLLVHGILHLLGMDHEENAEAEVMEARERELLAAHHRGGDVDGAEMIAASFGAADGVTLVVILILVVLDALLAIAETSLIRTSKARARALVEQKRPGARSLARLVENPEGFLNPVLLLVLVCQLVSATLVGVIASKLFGGLGIFAATVFEVIVFFVAAEAVPKTWAVRNPDRAALFASPLVSWVIAFPPVKLVAGGLIGISRLIIRDGDHAKVESQILESELLALADVAVEADVIEVEERALFSSIIEFGDTIVREVMAPRPDVIAVSEKDPVDSVLELAIAEGLSRIPVYRGSVDDIVGIAYTRDLILAVRNDDDTRPVGQIARAARYVPEQKRVAPLLREMQRAQFHIAVVVDEYGGTAGIVTLEDLIEELVGEIADEYDTDEPEVEVLGETELRVPGRMAVDEVNEVASVHLPTGDWDTIAGLLLHLRGQPPTEGESIMAGDVELVAERVQGRRVRTVRIVRPVTHHDDEEEER